MGCSGSSDKPGSKPPAAGPAAAGGKQTAPAQQAPKPEQKKPQQQAPAPPPAPEKGKAGTAAAASAASGPLPPEPTSFFSPGSPGLVDISRLEGRKRNTALVPTFTDNMVPEVDLGICGEIEELVLQPQPRRKLEKGAVSAAAEQRAAGTLGLDAAKDGGLLWLARGLAEAPLPVGWTSVQARSGVVYCAAGEAVGQEEHPMVAHYRHLAHDARRGVTGAEGRRRAAAPVGGAPAARSTPTRAWIRGGAAPATDALNERWAELWASGALMIGQVQEREKALRAVLSDFHEQAAAAASRFAVRLAAGGAAEAVDGELLLTLLPDRDAAKTAGHDTRAARWVLASNIPQLCVPLHCVVRYLGARILVAAAVPCDQDTRLFGPEDSSLPLERRRPAAAESGDASPEHLLQIVAADLRLRSHRIATAQPSPVGAGSATVQCHKGRDGRLYVLGCGGLLPALPVAQVDDFRPELVRQYRAEQADRFFTRSEADVLRDLQVYLTEKKVPEFAKKFVSNEAIQDGESLTQAMHTAGINMRQLGAVLQSVERSTSPGGRLSKILQAEMAARCLKHGLRTLPDIDVFFQRFQQDPNTVVPEMKKRFGFTGGSLTVKGDAVIMRLGQMLRSPVDRLSVGGEMKATIRALNTAAIHSTNRVRHRPVIFTQSRGHQRLRPELMVQLAKLDSLNADGLSPDADPEDLERDMKSIDTMFRVKMFNPLFAKEAGIPVFASHLLNKPSESGADLVKMMHDEGINCRYLGAIADFCIEWQSGEWQQTVMNPDTQTPVAIELVLTEMVARTFRVFLDEAVYGMSYMAATQVAKEAFQKLLFDPAFLAPRMRKTFGGPLKFSFPPAQAMVTRCCELCGATVTMASAEDVGEVMLNPVVKGLALPDAICVGRFVSDEPPTMAELAAMHDLEVAIDSRVQSIERQNSPSLALYDLALLSVLYDRWGVVQDGAKSDELRQVREEMLRNCTPGSEEAGDVNMLLGDYWERMDDAEGAVKYFGDAVSVYEKLGAKGIKNLIEALKSLGEAHAELSEDSDDEAHMRSAVAAFRRARTEAEKVQPDGWQNTCAEMDTKIAGALEQDDIDAAKQLYLQAITLWEREKDHEEEIGETRTSLARAFFNAGEYAQSREQYNFALQVKRGAGDMDAAIADDLCGLGQVEMMLAQTQSTRGGGGARDQGLEKAAQCYEEALSIYEKTIEGKEMVDKCQLVLRDHLVRVHTVRGRTSDAKKAELRALEYNCSEGSGQVGKKLLEIAVELSSELAQKQGSQRAEAEKETATFFQRALKSLLISEDGMEDDRTAKCRYWLKKLGASAPPVADATMPDIAAMPPPPGGGRMGGSLAASGAAGSGESIEELERQKAVAISQENYQEASRLKKLIERQRAG